MTRHPASFSRKRLFRILTTALAAVTVSGGAFAQQGEEETTVIDADRLTGRPDREVYAEGNVVIERGPSTVYADQATYDIVEDEVHAIGSLRLLRSGNTYTGEELRLRIAAGKGYVSQPTYELVSNRARGQAKRLIFESQDRATAYEGTYSTCEGPNPDWYLQTSRLDLDYGRERGVGYGTWVYFKGVPVLAAPVMSFPLTDERKSGVLPPTFGTTNRGGFELQVPYYFNIAPNRDLTLYPRVYSRRGLQLGAEARYLEPNFWGETYVEGMAKDNQTGTSRYALSSKHTQNLTPRTRFSWDLNHASDSDYPNDFARTDTAAQQRLLIRDAILTYGGAYWSAAARVSGYQVLQDPNAPIGQPYYRLPQLTARASRMTDFGDWVVDSELTRFWHDDLVRGNRFVVNPSISYPFLRPGWFLTPRLALHSSYYQLETPNVAGSKTNLSRTVPTFSLDSGLVFERDTTFFGAAAVQTLEPRLFYVYTPYRDQSAFPNFDTAEADLSFAQLFSENRFVGNDRISDANHVTAALVSRFLDTEGGERLRLAIAQRFYLDPQRVTVGGVIREGRSDILLSAYGYVLPNVSLDGNLQYSEELGTVSRANVGARWSPAPRRVLNVMYRRDRPNNLKQIDISTQWPFATRWYGVARVNYSLPERQVAEALFGVEYKHDCWVFRVVAQRTPTSVTQASTSIFVQLELTGLTRLGSNPLDALRNNIPGYQLVTDP